jgi:lipopolysaccharide export system permease protein
LKRIDAFILRSYLGPFVLTFFIAIFILLMQFVWKYVDDLVGKGLEILIIAKLLGLVALTMISLALPLAILLSSLMTFGNLGEYMELTAMKASGISLQRAMRPVLVLCLFMSLGAFFFSNYVLPIANLKMKTLLSDITNKRPELNIKPGIFNSDIPNYVIRIGKKSSDGKQLTDIMIYDHSRHNGNERLITAERGQMGQSADKRYLELRLFNGASYTEAGMSGRRRQNFPFLREQFNEDLIRFDLSLFDFSKTDENLYKKNYQMLNLAQLQAETDTLVENLRRDKLYLPKVLFNGPYYDLNKAYSTKVQEEKPKKVNSDTLNTSFDSTAVDSSELRLKNKILLRRMMSTGEVPDSAQMAGMSAQKLEEVAQIRTGRTLKNKKKVLENFTPDERIRILEQASNAIRAGKSTLEFSIQTFDQEQERIYRHEIEWHRKFTLSFACLVLFLIGAPLGAIVRKGGLGMPVVFSLIFFILYHMISITGEKLAREGVFTPFWGMWFSSAILLPVGLFLTYKSTRDSALLNAEAYLRVFQSIGAFFRSKAKA